MLLHVLLHSREAPTIGLMHLRNVEIIAFARVLFHLHHQLATVQLAIAPTSNNDLRLLLEGEVLPLLTGIDNITIERHDLVVRDGTWVGEIEDARLAVFGQRHRDGEEIVQDAVAVGDVDDLRIIGDLRHEVACVQVVGDWHPESKDEAVGVGLHHVFDARLGVGVEAAAEVGSVVFCERCADYAGAVFGVLRSVDA